MSRYQDYNRTRNKTGCFRLTPEKCRQIEERIEITGLPKNVFMIRSMLEQHISIRAGKFESDRLSLEVCRLKNVLKEIHAPEETVNLLLECRAVME